MENQPISKLVGFSKGVLESNVPLLGCQIPNATDKDMMRVKIMLSFEMRSKRGNQIHIRWVLNQTSKIASNLDRWHTIQHIS